MTTSKWCKRWWKGHEGWIAACFVAISSFALGYVCAASALSFGYREDMQRMAEAYRTAVSSKDQVIARLASSTAVSAKAAVDAIDAADTANETMNHEKEAKHRTKGKIREWVK